MCVIGVVLCAGRGEAQSHPDASAGNADALQHYTVSQAVELAVSNNLTLLAARTNVAMADAEMITARLRPNPVLSASADTLDWLGTQFSEENGLGPSLFGLRVDMPFERGGKREFRMETASLEKAIAEAELADAVRRLRLDVTVACIDLLEAKAKLQLARDNLTSFEGLVQLNQRRFTSGAIAPVELTRVRVAMLQYRNVERGAELAVAQARIRVLPLLGRSAEAPGVDIDGELGVAIGMPAPTLAEAQASAREHRADLQALRAEQARSQSDLRLQVAQGKVDYTLGAAVERQHGVMGSGNALGIFLSVPVPVFNRNQGEIARATLGEEKAATTERALATDVSGEVAAAFQEFESAQRVLRDIETDLLVPSREARETTSYVYTAGATSLLDVLDAQRAFNDTMDTYYSAQADYRRAQVRLISAAGLEVTP